MVWQEHHNLALNLTLLCLDGCPVVPMPPQLCFNASVSGADPAARWEHLLTSNLPHTPPLPHTHGYPLLLLCPAPILKP